MIRDEVKELASLGPMPNSSKATPEKVDKYGDLVLRIQRPLTDEEARLLLNSFGDDDFFGVAWELMHLIETAPHSPVDGPPSDSANEWIRRIWLRGQRAEM
jgi:hypothetical protein